MFNSETLEVGIGMAFLFLLMSLICTGVNEWLEGLFRWRAMDLERALRTLLNDDGGQLTALLFAHPLISSLHEGSYQPSELKKGFSKKIGWVSFSMPEKMSLRARRTLPSYIPAANFAKALIDLVGRGPANVDGENEPKTLLTVAQLHDRAAALDSPFLRRAVLSAIDHCNGDLKQLTENLQNWFDSSMDRASGWYKRRTQTVLFLLGLSIAVWLNVDALHVMSRLTADKTFREAVIGAATKAASPGLTPPAAGAVEIAYNARKELDSIGMPIGWHTSKAGDWLPVSGVQMCKMDTEGNCVGDTGYSWGRMFLGWLITAFAVMLGAPFWFDLLNKFMVIRSTVKPHEKSREEGSEDRPDQAAAASRKATTAPVPPPPPAPVASATQAGGAFRTSVSADAMSSLPPFVPHEWLDNVTNPKEIAL